MTFQQKTKQAKLFVPKNRAGSFEPITRSVKNNDKYWNWGDDNMFPLALALMSRRSTTHRRIINDKADYISGKGFSFALDNLVLKDFTEKANGSGESLRQIINKVAFDKCLFGNAFLEIVTNKKRSFLSLFHQDASKCRLSKNRDNILLHHNWAEFKVSQAESLPLYPRFKESSDGIMRSMIHYKDYEPMFENYGIPSYIAGMNVSAIAYKTDRWNISRLDNSFQLSGVMMLDAEVDNEDEAHRIVSLAEKQFAGKPGQIMFMVKNSEESDNTKFVPLTAGNDGDWKQLHEQATSDIVVAHSWFRSLSGLDYSSGFSTERILHEFEIALNTLILAEQQELLEPLKEIIENTLGCETESLQIVNRPPTRSKPLYMKVWEARKSDGLEYDPADPQQNLFVAQITKYAMRNID